jgi:hypothetical protein
MMNNWRLTMKSKLFLFFIIFSGFLMAQTKVGTTAANFLTIPIGPRATAMGSSFSSVANDVTAAYWNPGALSRVPRNEFSVAYTEWLLDTQLNWFGVVFKFDEDNAVAISINQLDYGNEIITTPNQPDGTGERWNAQDLAFGISYARNLTDRFSIGGNLKYISQQIWNESASAFALDVGLLFHTELEGLRLGMNIANFGTEMKLEGKDLLQATDIDPSSAGNNPNIASNLGTDSWPLPLIFTVGISYDFINNDTWLLTAATDANIPNNYSTYTNFGLELTWNNLISLRGGYKGYNYLIDKAGKEADLFQEGLTAGVGVHYDFGGFFAKVDYSYSDYGIFNEISRFSVSIGL